MFIKHKTKKESGMSLVELVVAIGLFGAFSVFVTGAFMNIISIQKQTAAKQNMIDNFRVALDLMGREIVHGTAFNPAVTGDTELYFSTHVRPDMSRRVIHYKLQGGRILKAQQNTLETCQVAYSIFPERCFVPFTSEDIYIDSMNFYVKNFDENGLGHPIIIITATGEVDVFGKITSFGTAVSYSPRSNVNPQLSPPSDTTPPVVEIQFVGGSPVTDINLIDGYLTSIRGIAYDLGGSGIRRIRLHNLTNGHVEVKNYYECSGDYTTHRAGADVVFGATGAWYDSNWQYRFRITSNHTLVREENSNLYFDLSLAPPSFWDHVAEDGGDIRVTRFNGTEVAREVSGFNKDLQRGSLFFDSTGVSTSVDTHWYVYFGNPGVTEPAPGSTYGRHNVWDDDYVGVWHFDEGDYGTAIPNSQLNTLFVKILMSRGGFDEDPDAVRFSGAVLDSNKFLHDSGLSTFSSFGFHAGSVPKQSRVDLNEEREVISSLLTFRTSPSTNAINRVQNQSSQQSGLVSLTLDDQPTEGNLLIAVLSNRSDGVYPEISGSGWQQVFNTCFSVEGGDCGAQYPYDEMHWHRRGMAVWWKIADSSEPATTTARWINPDGQSPNATLVIQEFEAIGGNFLSNALESFVVDNSRTESVTTFENAFYPPLGAIRDSTRNELHGIAHANSKIKGTLQGRMNTSSLVSGMLGNALYFDGIGDLIRISDTGTNITGNQFTLSAWVKRNFTCNDSACDNGIISKAHESDPDNKERYHLGIRRNNAINIRRHSGPLNENSSNYNSEHGLGFNVWQHIVGVYNGNHLRPFLNGQSNDASGVISGNINSSNDDLLFGGRYDVNHADLESRRFYTGFIDEVRISKVARPVDWIRTEYNNQSNQNAFWTVGVSQGEEDEGDIEVVDQDGVIIAPISLNGIRQYSGSLIEWSASIPSGSTLEISVAVNDSRFTEPGTWTPVTSGSQIPSSLISLDEDLSDKYLWIRRSSTDLGGDPRLEFFRVYVEGVTGHLDCGSYLGSEWHWSFNDVKIVGGGVPNTIRISALDYSNNEGRSEVIVVSTSDPEPPATPVIVSNPDTAYECRTNAAGVDHIRLRIRENSAGGNFDTYRIFRGGSQIDEISRNTTSPITAYHDSFVVEGVMYGYWVVAVNTVDNLLSDESDPFNIQITSGVCDPQKPYGMTAQLRCSDQGEPTNRLTVFGKQRESFRFYENSDPLTSIAQGGGNFMEFSWDHRPLTVGQPYSYFARGCFGDDCSDPTSPPTDPITVTDFTCVPPESSVRFDFDFNCVVHSGNPRLAVTVPTAHTINPDDLIRDFTHYVVYECPDALCDTASLGPANLLGMCLRGNEDECVIGYYPRERDPFGNLPTFHYRVRTYNADYDDGSSNSYGEYSDVGSYTVPHICEPGTSRQPDVEANLRCNTDSSVDFRQIDIEIDNHNNQDPASHYEVYRCGSEPGSCDPTPFGTCTWTEMANPARDICVSDFGPSDNMIHYYKINTCVGSDCYTYDFEVGELVASGACHQHTPGVAWIDRYQAWWSCSAPGAPLLGSVHVRAGFSPEYQEGMKMRLCRVGGPCYEREPYEGATHASYTFGGLSVGSTYSFTAQARNPYAEPQWGPVSPEVSITVQPNICDPTVPPNLTLTHICNWSSGGITGVTARASGSNNHQGYRITRDPGSVTGTHNEGGSWTDNFSPITSGSPTYTYTAVSYRDGLTSAGSISRTIILSPSVLCGQPFTLDGPASINVSLTGNTGAMLNSPWADIEINPQSGFSGTVSFEVSLTDVRSGLTITTETRNNPVSHPYNNEFGVRARIVDGDFGITTPVLGANLVVRATFGTFTVTRIIPFNVGMTGGGGD